MARSMKTMTAKLTDGREITWKTSSDKYDVAGIALYPDGTVRVVTQGWSFPAVSQRLRAAVHRNEPRWPGLKGETVSSREATAPVLHKYFGTHCVRVHAIWTGRGAGWEVPVSAEYATRSRLRQLAASGVLAASIGLTRADGTRWSADFQMTEIVKSLNSRKGHASA